MLASRRQFTLLTTQGCRFVFPHGRVPVLYSQPGMELQAIPVNALLITNYRQQENDESAPLPAEPDV
jgi:hypothetical protein